jgi:hypothetical protein
MLQKCRSSVARSGLAVAFGTLIVGCSTLPVWNTPTYASGPQAAPTPIPYVQNCAVLNTGTPSKFACNGKTYTSFQLAKIREDEAKKVAAAQ